MKIGTFQVNDDTVVEWDHRPRATFHLLLLPRSHCSVPHLKDLRPWGGMDVLRLVDQLARLESDAANVVRFFLERGEIDGAHARTHRVVVRTDAWDPLLCVHIVCGEPLPGEDPARFEWPCYVTLENVIARLMDEAERSPTCDSGGPVYHV